MGPIEILHKFEIFDHPRHANYEFGKIKKFEFLIWVTLEILLKFKIFDHPGPAKHDIWQNQEILVIFC